MGSTGVCVSAEGAFLCELRKDITNELSFVVVPPELVAPPSTISCGGLHLPNNLRRLQHPTSQPPGMPGRSHIYIYIYTIKANKCIINQQQKNTCVYMYIHIYTCIHTCIGGREMMSSAFGSCGARHQSNTVDRSTQPSKCGMSTLLRVGRLAALLRRFMKAP